MKSPLPRRPRRPAGARSGMAPALLAASLVLGAAGAPPAHGQEAADTAPPTKAEVVAAREAFATAEVELKKAVGDMMAFQTEYQKKDADRAGLEGKFTAAKALAMEASTTLENAAIVIARGGMPRKDEDDYAPSMPIYKEAVRTCMAIVASAIESDDPGRAMELVDLLERSGAISGETVDIYMMGATAAIILSRVEDADAYLGKLAAIGGSPDKQEQLANLVEALAEERKKVAEEMEYRAKEEAADDLPRVRIATSGGDLLVELFENEAPNTVANFISLVEKGFYDGTPFHRVIPEFMAQGGDPTGRGNGGPGYSIACETERPGARKHFRGSLSMAHAGKDTGGSQFFLTFRPTEHLDGKHTVFGRVIEGDEVLARIQRTQNKEGRPIPAVKPDTILKAEVVRKRDHAYEPQTIPGR